MTARERIITAVANWDTGSSGETAEDRVGAHYNCGVCEIGYSDGDIWIARPCADRWLNDAELAEVANLLEGK